MVNASSAHLPLRVGLFGGSFNPPHLGHLHVATQVREKLALDEVWLLPVPLNTLKSDKGMAPFTDRLAWCHSLAEPYPWLKTSDAEAHIATNETIDTVRFFKATYPAHHFVWIMGFDSFASIDEWGPSRLFMQEIAAVVVPRNTAEETVENLNISKEIKHLESKERAINTPGWQLLEIPTHPASATAIRHAWQHGEKSVHLSETVYAQMLRTDNLYKNP